MKGRKVARTFRPGSRLNRGRQVRATFAWRKLSAAKWEDVWWDRLSEFRERLAISALAGMRTIRVEVFALSKVEAARLVRAFGGQVRKVTHSQQLPAVAVRTPIKVRDRIVVVATAGEAVGETRKRLVIPAGMAFGTGDHATTATCLRLLADASEELAGQRWEMLDLGCGTGILALAGRLLGARRVLAGDFDPDSVRTAKENARANRIDRVTVRRLDVLRWEPAQTWEVVAANMFSRILVEIAPKLAATTAAGGLLIVSGILRAQEREVVVALRAQGFRVERIVRKGKWVTGLARSQGDSNDSMASLHEPS